MNHSCPACHCVLSLHSGNQTHVFDVVLATAYNHVTVPITHLSLSLPPIGDYLEEKIYSELNQRLTEGTMYEFECPHCHSVLSERQIVQFLEDEDKEEING